MILSRNKGWPMNGYPKWLLGREVNGAFYIEGGSDHWLVARWLGASNKERFLWLFTMLFTIWAVMALVVLMGP